MTLARLALGVLTFAMAASAAGDGPRVTVVTLKGEALEGTLVGTSSTEVTVALAGANVQIPLSGVKYISLVGRLDASAPTPGAAAAPAAPSYQDALAALDALSAELAVGVSHPQYSERALKYLPPVTAYLRTGTDYPDARWLLKAAVDIYQGLNMNRIVTGSAGVRVWNIASVHFDVARSLVEDARRLFVAGPAEAPPADHAVREIVLGAAPLEGSITAVDAVAPAGIEPHRVYPETPFYADSYRIAAPGPGKVIVTLKRPALLAVRNQSGKIEKKNYESNDVNEIEFKVSAAGPVEVWAYAYRPASYTISARFQEK